MFNYLCLIRIIVLASLSRISVSRPGGYKHKHVHRIKNKNKTHQINNESCQ